MSSGRRAMSLAETLLAVAIVASALICLIGVMGFGMKMLLSSREVSVATAIGREVLERTRFNLGTTGFNYLPSGSYVYDGRNPDATTGVAPAVFPPAPYPASTFNGGNYVVVVRGDQPTLRVKTVTVEVYWGSGSDHRITLVSRFHP